MLLLAKHVTWNLDEVTDLALDVFSNSYGLSYQALAKKSSARVI
jgi:hypothetical protein